MVKGSQSERRKVKHDVLTLQPSFLLHIPPKIAWSALIAITCALSVAEYFSSPAVWFGPAYLTVITFAAWSLSCRVAIGLGVVILSLKMIAINLGFYPSGPGFEITNIALKFFAILFVVALIGVARKSCEKEWRLARFDALTGAMNRQAFFEYIEKDNCSDGWTALIYLDLDGLKDLNDHAGHAQGDISLAQFSKQVRSVIRESDVFARIGGDEFVIFMKIRNEESGMVIVKKLNQALNDKNLSEPSRLGCSFGVLLLSDGLISIDAELQAADALMYQAKRRRGRGLVATATEFEGKIVPSNQLSVVSEIENETIIATIGTTLAGEKPQKPAPKCAA